MTEVFAHLPEILRAAATSAFGILALSVSAVSILAYLLFRRASERSRLVIFFSLLLGTAAFAMAALRVSPPDDPCKYGVQEFAFEEQAPYLAGLTTIRLGTLLPAGVQTIIGCGLPYRVEEDQPPIRRLEVIPRAGLISGVTYYSYANQITTIGFSLSSKANHSDLRTAAVRRYGPPTATRTGYRGMRYDEWRISGITLVIFDEGGSIFLP